MKDFLEKQLEQAWNNIDKLLVFAMFIAATATALYIHNTTKDEGSLDWARDLSSNLLAGFMGLIGGAKVRKILDKKENDDK